ncbi:hypothetical protein CKQ84_07595 [Shewanella sp. WE21]|uniref:hypothetical protein n=1 Tax=Shewanella sp. WE21 TaxID=2029986 RepID=UPI000CF72760|nr:hypothetical protein [Shewanella sp. WE21]AVI65767.1 hypothetical protein CKQ84_07595 [Shewanella sp. WE21]
MKKLKQHYKHKVDEKHSQYLWNFYPSIRSGIHKRFSTKQEKSFYFIHLIECRGYPVKLRAARGKALAEPWDDYPTYVYDVAKSWKHSSKRKHQYYR